jgi:hypothetical protein
MQDRTGTVNIVARGVLGGGIMVFFCTLFYGAFSVTRLYSRADQLDQIREAHFRRQQSACSQRLISISSTTYSCELMYSALKFITSKYRSVQNCLLGFTAM